MHGRFRRLLLVGGIMALLSVGASYTWTFTPSYSLYRIRQALLAHDYVTFSHYVDVDSVLLFASICSPMNGRVLLR